MRNFCGAYFAGFISLPVASAMPGPCTSSVLLIGWFTSVSW
jgi:hypothetical protein